MSLTLREVNELFLKKVWSMQLIRRHSDYLSRNSDFISEVKDILTRIYVVGDPVINEKFRKCIRCKKCGEFGHQRECKVNLNSDATH